MPQTPIEPPETLEWRKYLYVSPTSPPPDLLVRIKKLAEKEFQWTVLSPHQDFTHLQAEELHCELSAARSLLADALGSTLALTDPAECHRPSTRMNHMETRR